LVYKHTSLDSHNLMRCFKYWQQFVADKKLQDIQIASIQRKQKHVAMRRGFHAIRRYALQSEQLSVDMHKHFNQWHQRHCLLIWSQRIAHKQRIKLFVTKLQCRFVRVFFHIWKRDAQKQRNSKHLHRKYAMKQLRGIFGVWNRSHIAQRAQQQVIETQIRRSHQVQLLQRCFRSWRTRNRLNAIEMRVRLLAQHRLQKRILSDWHQARVRKLDHRVNTLLQEKVQHEREIQDNAEQRKRCEQLLQVNQKLHTAVTEIQLERNNLNVEASRLREQLNEEHTLAQHAKQQIEQLHKKMENLQEECYHLEDEMKKADTSHEEQLKTMLQRCTELEIALIQEKKEHAEAVDLQSLLKKQYDMSLEAQRKELIELNKSNEMKDEELYESRQQCLKLQSELQQCAVMIQEEQTNIEKLISKHNGHRDIPRKHQDCLSLAEQICCLEQYIKQLIETYETTCTELRQLYENANADLELLREQHSLAMKDHQLESNKLAGFIESLQNQLSTKSRVIAALELQIHDIQRSSAVTSPEQARSINKHIELTEALVVDLRQELNDAQHTIDKQMLEIQELRDQNNIMLQQKPTIDIQQRLATLQEQLAHCEDIRTEQAIALAEFQQREQRFYAMEEQFETQQKHAESLQAELHIAHKELASVREKLNQQIAVLPVDEPQAAALKSDTADDLRTQLEAARHELNLVHEQLQHMQTSRTQLIQQNSELRVQNAELEASVAVLQEDADKETNRLMHQCASAQDEIDQLRQQIAFQAQQLQTFQQICDEANDRSHQKDNIESEYIQLKRSHAELQQALQQSLTDKSNLDEQVAALQQQLQHAEVQLISTSQQLQVATTEINDRDQSVMALQSDIQLKLASVDELKRMLSDSSETIEKLEKEKVLLAQQIQENEIKHVKTVEHEAHDIQIQLTEYQIEIVRLQEQNTTLSREFQKCCDHKNDLKRACQLKTDEISQLLVNLATIQAELQHTSSAQEQSKIEIEQLKVVNKSLQKQLEDQHSQHAQVSEQLRSAEMLLDSQRVELASAVDQHAQLLQIHNAYQISANDGLSQLNVELSDAKEQVMKLHGSVSSLEQLNNQMQDRNCQLSDQIQQLNDRLDELKERNEQLSQRNNLLEKENEQIKLTNSDLNHQLDQCRSDTASQQQTIGKQEESLCQIGSNQIELEQKYKQALEQLHRKSSEVDETNTEVC